MAPDIAENIRSAERALAEIGERMREGDEYVLWSSTAELGELTYAELNLGLRPTIPSENAILEVRDAYRAYYLGVPYGEIEPEFQSEDGE